MDNITLGLAFIAGFLSFISPCVLPLVPAYVGYMSGRMSHSMAAGSKAKTADQREPARLIMVLHGTAFVLGFSLVFVSFGIMATALGSIAGGAAATLTEIIARIGGVIIVFFGLHFMGVIPAAFRWIRNHPRILTPLTTLVISLLISGLLIWGFGDALLAAPAIIALWLGLLLGKAFTDARNFWLKIINRIQEFIYSDTRQEIAPRRRGLSGSFFMGVVFSAGWTPCIGPLLGAILTMAATTGDIPLSIQMLGAYSLGLGVPFILTALLLDGAQSFFRRLQPHMRRIELISGTLLVIIGLGVASGQMTLLSQRLNNEFADLTYRVEECGIGFFRGSVGLEHLGSCVGGSLIPTAINQSVSIHLDEDKAKQEIIFAVEESATVDIELINFDGTTPPVIELYAPDENLVNRSDTVTKVDERSSIAMSDVQLSQDGIHLIIVSMDDPTDTEPFRLRVVPVTEAEDQPEAENAEPALDSANINTIEDLAASASVDADGNVIGPDVGEQAPGFTLTSVDGETITLSDYRGQFVLVNFWGTWCGPCRREMPDLQHLHETNDDLQIIGVAVFDTEQAVREFRDEFGISFPLAIDVGNRVNGAYQVPGQPSTYIINEEGTVIWRSFSIILPEQVETVLQEARAN